MTANFWNTSFIDWCADRKSAMKQSAMFRRMGDTTRAIEAAQRAAFAHAKATAALNNSVLEVR